LKSTVERCSVYGTVYCTVVLTVYVMYLLYDRYSEVQRGEYCNHHVEKDSDDRHPMTLAIDQAVGKYRVLY